MWCRRFLCSIFAFACFFLSIGAAWAQPVATDPTKEPYEKAVQTLQSLKANLTDLKSRMASEFKGVELRTQTLNSGIQVYTLTPEQVSSPYFKTWPLGAKGWLGYEDKLGLFADGKLELEIVKKYFPNIEKRANISVDQLYADAIKTGAPLIPR